MDNIDMLISNVVSKKIYESIEFEQNIFLFLNKNKKNSNIYKSIIKFIITFFITIITTIGIVFAKDISDRIYNILNPISTGEGLINMVQKGYLYNTQMEYVNSKGNKLKIEYIIMDDYNLSIVFDLQTKEKIENVYMIEISDLIISDENNNIIFCSYNNDVYKKFCRENDLEYRNDWIINNYTNGGYQTEIIDKNDNSIKFIYKMYSNGYPKSKKLLVKFGNIEIIPTSNDIITNNKKIINGRWNLKFELPKDFFDREIIQYEMLDNKEDIIIESVVCSYTEMHLSIKIKNAVNAINATEIEVQNRLEDILKDKHYEIIDNPIIENERGEIFEISSAEREGNFSKIYRKNGDLDIQIIFPLTKYDYTDILKLKMLYKETPICINLVKK